MAVRAAVAISPDETEWIRDYHILDGPGFRKAPSGLLTL
jgi:hypothetical protein